MTQRRSLIHRKSKDLLFKGVSILATALALLVFVFIMGTIINRGIGSLNVSLFTKLPSPPGVGNGGIANAIVGTLVMVSLASAIAIPIGIMAGIFLSEYRRDNRIAHWIRLATNIILGVPSIIIGLFIYTLMVIRMGHFSGFAGAVALSLIMVPIITRTTEDTLHLVPHSLRESALALGAQNWKVIIQIVLRASQKGMITGIILAIARVCGETAPLLFTALNSQFEFISLNQPTPNITVTLYNYALSPFKDWQQIAWGASLLITIGVFGLTVISQLLIRKTSS
jgi:phosphate transport system permease protein